jgi:F-type H+-transporting ATPase subunit b
MAVQGDASLWSFLKNIPTIYYQAINLAILIAILVKFGTKPLKDFLAARRSTVKEKLDEADRILAEAEALKKSYEEKLAGLDEEIAVFKKTVTDEAEKEKARIVGEANQLAAKMQEQARIAYEQEIKETTRNIREEIAKLTVEKAEKLILEKINAADHAQMVDDFIAKLRSMN